MTDQPFTHLDQAGRARMVDVSGNPVTVRTATAEALVRCPPQVVTHLRDQTVPKGDVLAVDRIAVIANGRLSPARPVAQTNVEEIGVWMSGMWPRDEGAEVARA